MSVPEDDHPESDLKQPGFECQFTDQQDYVTSRVCSDCKKEAWSKLCIHIIHNSFNLGWFFPFLPKTTPKDQVPGHPHNWIQNQIQKRESMKGES